MNVDKPSALENQESERVTATWMLWGLVVPMIVYAARMVEVLVQTTIPFDSAHTYLPLARQMLEDGFQLFSTPESYKVAPGAVVYMALAGADPLTIKMANLAISMTALALSFDAARRIGGRVAAVATSWLYVLPHMLVEAGATLMGESPFIFLVALWLWGSSCAAQTRTELRGRAWSAAVVVLAALALAAATLTRATYMYWLPIAVLAFSFVASRLQGQLRDAALRIAIIHLIAAVLVGTYVIRQNETFGRPMVATGSGAALYFGSNPVLSGYEPPFFGLAHDESTVVGGMGHLSLEGDKRLMAVAKTMLSDLPNGAILEMYVQKLGAVLFFSRAHLGRQVLNDRAWRVTLVLLALLGLWGGRHHPMVWMVGAAAAYQCAVHVPVLYNPRYSISALDVLLVLIAAQGISWAWSRQRRGTVVACILMILVGGIAVGFHHQRHSRALLPEFSLIPPQSIAVAQGSQLHADGWDNNPFHGPARMTSDSATVVWDAGKPLPQDAITLVHLGMRRFEGRCRYAWLTQRSSDNTTRTTQIRLNGLREGQDINWGTHHVMLPEKGPSQIQLRFECDHGTLMQFGEMGLYQASPGRHYSQQALGK